MIKKINGLPLSFGAKIIMTPYLQEGLYTASNTKETSGSIKEKVEFLNALALISQDKTFDTFEIRGDKKYVVINPKTGQLQKRKNRILINGKTIEQNLDISCPDIFDGHNCMAAVTAYSKKKYGKFEYADNNFEKMLSVANKIRKEKAKLDNFFITTIENNYGQDLKELSDKHEQLVKNLPERFRFIA